jgi:HKD family nuclease
MGIRKRIMSVIDNDKQTLLSALDNALTTADRVDIAVGFFYFSGFQALAKLLVVVYSYIPHSLIGTLSKEPKS